MASDQNVSVKRTPTVAGATTTGVTLSDPPLSRSPPPLSDNEEEELVEEGQEEPVQQNTILTNGTASPEDRAQQKPTNESSGWLPAVDQPAETVNGIDAEDKSNNKGRSGSVLRKKSLTRSSSRPTSPQRASSVRSSRSARGQSQMNGNSPNHASLSRANSVASVGRRSIFTNGDGRPVNGSAFINGAGVTGPGATAEADESLHQRRATADATLTPKQRSKITKKEAKDGRVLSKIIKTEGRVEKEALNVAVRELAELQKIQQAAIKREAKAHTDYTRTQAELAKAETEFLAARSRYETAQAHMKAFQDTLDITRSNAREATEMMQEKSQEVDALQQLYGVDERERAVKLNEMRSKGVKTGSGISRLFGR